ncbi:2-dehydro-3-deoxygalactonokinase [Ciceribacter thiooxidans]|uniref:2-dehydro-3-deoxygalactonokinase n=1 Tax=Ciceribacter thiooxidans TaxID=1969821 RepID=A0ABV7I278_9HYPH|nr:2-dehydro-3-deoxygalactonokinase [Ciceribacter thiooxidans]
MTDTEAETTTAGAFCALADWGTSNFRLWVVDRAGNVLGRRQSDEGLLACADGRFAAVLESHLAALGASADLPVAITGMAGARTGWREAPYVETPAPLDALYRQAVTPEGVTRPVFILPGVCQRTTGPFDVMRGEETQLAGAVGSGLADGIFCLPGTHSKWVELKGGRIATFRTVMTGELFDLLSRHSILRHSIGDDLAFTADDRGFSDGVTEALAEGFALTAHLFSIRAAGLLGGDAPKPAARLSGMLIGAEIAATRTFLPQGMIVHLVGSARLTALYGRALEIAGTQSRLLDGEDLVRKGLFAAASSLFQSSEVSR